MILPLHHCSALHCLELINPREIMCRKHWEMVSEATMKQLVVTPPGSRGRKHAEMQARIEVAQAEGITPCFTAHDLATSGGAL
jgi:hypothetical protein